MSEPFLAEIRIFAGNFAPRGWALCNGQLMPISQNTALFSLLGVNYGGDGKVTFALPNLQGSSPMHWGNGPGLTPRILGESGGENTLALIVSEMPAHTHTAMCDPIGITLTNAPKDGVWAIPETEAYNSQPSSRSGTMDMRAISTAGGSMPHNNMQPFLGLTFIIALEGIFPARP